MLFVSYISDFRKKSKQKALRVTIVAQGYPKARRIIDVDGYFFPEAFFSPDAHR